LKAIRHRTTHLNSEPKLYNHPNIYNLAMATSHLHLLPLVLRSTQAILSLTSLCLYATALASSPKDNSAYIYALVCCIITLSTLAIYTIPSFPTRKFFLWDFCVAVLWAALSGVFGMRHLRDEGEGGEAKGNEKADKTAMKVAVGIDLVVMVAWVVTCFLGCVGHVRAKLQTRRQRKEGKEVERMLEGQERGVVEVEWDDDGDCGKGFMGEKSEKGEKASAGY
jgi:hypothetical protein